LKCARRVRYGHSTSYGAGRCERRNLAMDRKLDKAQRPTVFISVNGREQAANGAPIGKETRLARFQKKLFRPSEARASVWARDGCVFPARKSQKSRRERPKHRRSWIQKPAGCNSGHQHAGFGPRDPSTTRKSIRRDAIVQLLASTTLQRGPNGATAGKRIHALIELPAGSFSCLQDLHSRGRVRRLGNPGNRRTSQNVSGYFPRAHHRPLKNRRQEFRLSGNEKNKKSASTTDRWLRGYGGSCWVPRGESVLLLSALEEAESASRRGCENGEWKD